MANQTIKASIVGLVLVGSMTCAPVVKAEYTPDNNGSPKSGEDAGSRSFKQASDILKGCKTDADGNKVCPNDLGVVAFEPKDNGAPDRTNGEGAGSRYHMNVNGVPYILFVPA